MEATNVTPAGSVVIDINKWNNMSPEQRAALPKSVQAMFQPAAAAAPHTVSDSTPSQDIVVPPPSKAPTPAVMTPNQDVVIPPAPIVDSTQMTLAERKAIRRGAVESCPAGSRAWYQAWEVSFTDPNDISAMIAGIAIGAIAVAIVGGIVYLVKKQ